jgi:hypothetical protein
MTKGDIMGFDFLNSLVTLTSGVGFIPPEPRQFTWVDYIWSLLGKIFVGVIAVALVIGFILLMRFLFRKKSDKNNSKSD